MNSLLLTVSLAVLTLFGSAAERPNIILLMADDLGWGDPSYNDGWIETPALDAMAAEGLRFDRFYSASAVCSPTRASCLTGRNPLRVGIPNANTGQLGPDETPLSEVLQEAGYTTGHFGKWHLGTLTTLRTDSNRGAPGNTAVYSPPWQHGYDVTFATEAKVPTFHPMRRTVNGLPEPVNFADPNFYGTRYWTNPNNLAAPEGVAVPVTENLSGDDSRVIMDRVIPFIQGAVTEDHPFFSVVWFHTPHKPLPDPDDTFPVDSDESYTKAIVEMDLQIARLRSELRSLGVAEDTMLWFCSDNGPENGVGSAGPFRARKRSLHEGGLRVPGILVWPAQIPDARTTSFPAVTSDYYPTILDYLEITVPHQKPIDGLSLRGAIENTDLIREEPIGFQYLNSRSWVNHRYKLISKNGGATFELYDLLSDPTEQNNIASANPEVVASMTREFEAWSIAVRDDTAYLPPEKVTTVILGTPNRVVDGPFSVSVSFSKPITGLEASDFIVSNGIFGELTGRGDSFTLTVAPLNTGNVTLQLPEGTVTDQEGDPNEASNSLVVFFSNDPAATLSSILIDDHFDTAPPSNWTTQGNAIEARQNLVIADSVLVSSVNSAIANSNRGLASEFSFDPAQNNGFSLTFVVDEIGQVPGANGFFLGIAGSNDVFYRDASTRNFGLTFFGIDTRTNSSTGFGLNFGDNFGATGAALRLDQGTIALDSFLDGFTATLTVDRWGWKISLDGVIQAGGLNEPILRNGQWTDDNASFESLFGNAPSWHVVTSNQIAASGQHTVAFERIRLVSGSEPPPRITPGSINPGDSQVTFSFETVEGWPYFIERSSDLESWQQAGEVVAERRTSSFRENLVEGFPIFYRIRRPR